VTVCERSDVVGGAAAGYGRDGFGFDTGPSLLTWPEQLRQLFGATGGWPAALQLTPVDPQVRYRFADGTVLDVPAGRGAHGVATGLGARAGAEWTGLLDHGARLWRTVGPAVLTRPRPGPARLVGMTLRHPRELPTVAPLVSLHGLARRRLADPRLRMVLDRYATYAGADPRRAPAALAVIAYLEQVAGCWHVTGGLHRIAAALAQRVGECGGQILFGAEVVRILGTPRVTGVALAGGDRLAAEAVVTDIAEQVVRERLLGRPSARLGGTPSLSGFSVLLALRDRAGLPHHQVIFPADYAREFDEVFAGRPASDPAIYSCCPTDPTMHPPGGAACRLLVNAPPQGRFDWTAPGVAERYAGQLLARLAERGLDLATRAIWREIRTPADLESTTGAPGGVIYGRAPHGPGGLRRRSNRGPRDGLYLVGGSVHPGGGVPLVLSSAAIVADLIAGRWGGIARR
jgi:phytoene desaturase